MKKIISNIYDKILPNAKNIRLIFPENDDRIKQAKIKLKKIGFNIVDLDDCKGHQDDFFNSAKKLKFSKNWPDDKLQEYLDLPLNQGINIVRAGLADALIAGASLPTSDLARSSLRFIGLNNKSNCLSSSFIMVSPNENRLFFYADCAIVPEPSESQLADIAYDTAESYSQLTGDTPKVAFLSFSTDSSASHYRVSKVKRAIDIFGSKYPNILHEKTELQFDAAICSDISKKKYSKSVLKGEANVLIYPNLDAGNIAYKITQRLGGYSAVGPLLQGLNKPIHDLSRGCSVNDIVDISIISAYQGMMNADI
ncbi:MAG: hypothetical protein CMG13_01735 [Candidatus Marinimicrobia bacterium]|nr:hypothetical protein [Candidatus Neomarinimicrobiota bacterium]|tara:strand:+ start:2904 stop:3833 length:930 start_codon:yes stop_codon:yes gene_type:complete